jgi:hypothetical protein
MRLPYSIAFALLLALIACDSREKSEADSREHYAERIAYCKRFCPADTVVGVSGWAACVCMERQR